MSRAPEQSSGEGLRGSEHPKSLDPQAWRQFRLIGFCPLGLCGSDSTLVVSCQGLP